MELKDVILSTLAEIEELVTVPEALEENEPLKEDVSSVQTMPAAAFSEPVPTVREDEARWLEGIRERLLVLFEGFQSPNNVQIEAKVDLTLNFLEYLLATIDNRLDNLK
ncbi:CiaD-like domain-containing protein [Sulfuricurvum sp.]|uniref:CiaD-like domain-containing protein n=1 Tax=Sulfuricurvum sp. TaxID=2025608 RepID=UPI003C625800